MKERNVHFMSNDQTWETPIDFYNELNKEFGFTLDPCCSLKTAKCEKFYTVKENGLVQDWGKEVVFMNPPYGREQIEWIKKAYNESLKENTIVVCLIPSRTDTKVWHDIIFPYAEVRFLKGRLKFGNSKNAAPFPSALVIFGKSDKK